MTTTRNPKSRRHVLSAAVLTAALALTGTLTASAAPGPTGAAASRQATPDDPFEPGPHHRLLDPLAGKWKAVKTNWLLGHDGEPVVSRDITVRTRWLKKTGGRFMEERTEGTLAGKPYFRVGVLGYSNIDRRYEWTTFDSVTPTAMTYRGAPDSGTAKVISIPGEFTDPGILGPENKGKKIPMRTEFRIRSHDRHTVDLFFTPPGQKERLVDRVEYTRVP
ncbi:DUF1579 family protein [Actinomycetota bacterium Odt1-20B]